MIFVYYFFAGVLVWLSFKSFRGGIAWLGFFRTELSRPRSGFAPFATIFAPCRGLDPDLESDLISLTRQDFPEYEIIFITDDAADPSVAVIERVLDAAAVSARLIIAPKATDTSQKVENLREGVLHASERSRVFAFVDSDVCVSADWLASLCDALADDAVGAASSYRWFIADRFSLGAELRSVWNASIASALGPNLGSNFCWGGSMAIRREVFEDLDICQKWSGTLSDDFAVTRAMKDAGRSIVFVSRAMPASPGSCSVREMLEFTTRQMKITRVYGTPLWVMSLFGSAMFNAVLIVSVLIAIFDADLVQRSVSLVTLALVIVLSAGKAWLRMRAVSMVLTGYRAALKRQAWFQMTLWAVAPAIFLYNSIAALLSRRMTWRGTVYELKSPTETVIISPNVHS